MAHLLRRMLPATLYLALVCALIAPGFAPARVVLAAGGANAAAYFSAQLDSTSFELWKTDGSANGTVLIRDIAPGPDDSQPYGFTNMNGTVYFSASTFSSIRQLWKTDGTTAGTRAFSCFNF